ncbi:MAG TPA: UbiX family flavin prenyltransferase [Desulfobacteria bacterium]|nr:UbiX family flavin prenyltransferase [Desulfobacteria bacterium]
MNEQPGRIVVGITGATGAVYGIKLLEALKSAQVETHLIITNWGKQTIKLETNYTLEEVTGLADYTYEEDNLAATLASGSFLHDGMVVCPCSMKTLAAIAHGYTVNLMIRAADVTLKEKRKLVLLPRETPLRAAHLENMLKLTQEGAIIMPPLPSFYNQPTCLTDVINQTVGRVLDMLAIKNDLTKRWQG